MLFIVTFYSFYFYLVCFLFIWRMIVYPFKGLIYCCLYQFFMVVLVGRTYSCFIYDFIILLLFTGLTGLGWHLPTRRTTLWNLDLRTYIFLCPPTQETALAALPDYTLPSLTRPPSG